MPLDYETKYKNAYKKNVEDAPEHANSGKLDKQINSFCKLHGFSREDVVNGINNNKMLAAKFAINPNKQNFYEKEAAKFIENIEGVTEFENLPNRKLLLIGGAPELADKAKTRGGSSEAKSIDFKWKYGGKAFYATHKYTKNSGGSQDNAYKDVRSFIREANETQLEDAYFIAIADGNYYQKKTKKKSKAKIELLRKLSNEDEVFACTIDELEDLMKKLCP